MRRGLRDFDRRILNYVVDGRTKLTFFDFIAVVIQERELEESTFRER